MRQKITVRLPDGSEEQHSGVTDAQLDEGALVLSGAGFTFVYPPREWIRSEARLETDQ